ncbi:hypothetical protein MPL3365_70544 [Mesorhizobium plurifarium]|uniref:Uncharacterized protein n=1 Tax=Mesorhizobium plurifarium TaxID=69974 RepID=A0A090GD95_MESPL|nr:hypothetical protein MPL3365_70544 [Mesorhizobium plurifarium]
MVGGVGHWRLHSAKDSSRPSTGRKTLTAAAFAPTVMIGEIGEAANLAPCGGDQQFPRRRA